MPPTRCWGEAHAAARHRRKSLWATHLDPHAAMPPGAKPPPGGSPRHCTGPRHRVVTHPRGHQPPSQHSRAQECPPPTHSAQVQVHNTEVLAIVVALHPGAQPPPFSSAAPAQIHHKMEGRTVKALIGVILGDAWTSGGPLRRWRGWEKGSPSESP